MLALEIEHQRNEPDQVLAGRAERVEHVFPDPPVFDESTGSKQAEVVGEGRLAQGYLLDHRPNVPLAVGYITLQIPYVGWLGTAAILGIEALLIIGNEHGLRIGDELAHTQVVDETIFDVESQS